MIPGLLTVSGSYGNEYIKLVSSAVLHLYSCHWISSRRAWWGGKKRTGREGIRSQGKDVGQLGLIGVGTIPLESGWWLNTKFGHNTWIREKCYPQFCGDWAGSRIGYFFEHYHSLFDSFFGRNFWHDIMCLLCTGSIPLGKSSHLFYCNCIACRVYNSFNKSFANPVLDFTESGEGFTELGGIGIWTSLGNCFAEYSYRLLWNPVVCSALWRRCMHTVLCFTVILKRGESVKTVNGFILTFSAT